MTYDEAIEKFGEEKIFGITTVGDIFYIPDIEELCLNIPKIYPSWDSNNSMFIDIRNYLIFEEVTIKTVNPIYSNIYNKYFSIANKELNKQGIIELIKAADFQFNKKQNPYSTFIESLTKNERDALSAVLSNLNKEKEGYVSIVKLVEQTKISRPVFKNLFIKMEKNNIAEIVNSGVKGTYIKILEEVDINGRQRKNNEKINCAL